MGMGTAGTTPQKKNKFVGALICLKGIFETTPDETAGLVLNYKMAIITPLLSKETFPTAF